MLKRNGIYGPTPSFFYGNYKQLNKVVCVASELICVKGVPSPYNIILDETPDLYHWEGGREGILT